MTELATAYRNEYLQKMATSFEELFNHLDQTFLVDERLTFEQINQHIDNAGHVDARTRFFATRWLNKHEPCCPNGLTTREVMGYIQAMKGAVQTLDMQVTL